MDKNLNWNLILTALNYRIQQLEEKVMICNCCEKFNFMLDDVKAELLAYKTEYTKVLMLNKNLISKGMKFKCMY